jgi:hypothetical protein
MPILRQRDLLKYNRDSHEIRNSQYGMGLTYRDTITGEGVWDKAKSYANRAKDKIMSAKASALGAVGEKLGQEAGAKIGKKLGEKVGDKIISTIGDVAKTGITHADKIKTGIDLIGTATKTGISIAKEAEDLNRSKKQTAAQERLDDEFFRQLRQQSDEIKKGAGLKRNKK